MHISFTIFRVVAVLFLSSAGAQDALPVFISEVVEGSYYNKGIEIYNPTNSTINLGEALCEIKRGKQDDGQDSVDLVYKFNASADNVDSFSTFSIVDRLAVRDLKEKANAVVINMKFKGHWQLQLVCNGTILDVFGDTMYPALGDNTWGHDVAGVVDATEDHTIARKDTIGRGNINWALSRGTNADDSEWIVMPQDTFDGFGVHFGRCETCTCTAHDYCPETQFCKTDGFCARCEDCHENIDGIDNWCPDKCGEPGCKGDTPDATTCKKCGNEYASFPTIDDPPVLASASETEAVIEWCIDGSGVQPTYGTNDPRETLFELSFNKVCKREIRSNSDVIEYYDYYENDETNCDESLSATEVEFTEEVSWNESIVSGEGCSKLLRFNASELSPNTTYEIAARSVAKCKSEESDFLRFKTLQCSGHEQCGVDQFCMAGLNGIPNGCRMCDDCQLDRHAVDGQCPESCGGAACSGELPNADTCDLCGTSHLVSPPKYNTIALVLDKSPTNVTLGWCVADSGIPDEYFPIDPNLSRAASALKTGYRITVKAISEEDQDKPVSRVFEIEPSSSDFIQRASCSKMLQFVAEIPILQSIFW